MIIIPNMQETGRRIELRKLVIKLGSAVIAGEGSRIDEGALGSLADSVMRLRALGVAVIIVSSGAIGMGRRQFPDFKPRTIPDRQALAAVGQVALMRTYQQLFTERGFQAAQVLLTRDDMEDRRRYLNARYTLERLLDLGVVPIINENDTVTVDELKFGDNDQLSAIVASKMNADLLVILSVVDGLHTLDEEPAAGDGGKRKPRRRMGELVRVVEHLDESILAHADTSRSSLGTGGMLSKLQAVHMATDSGVHAVLACGKKTAILDQITSGNFTGTYIMPSEASRMTGRGRWLAFGRQAHGRRVIVDDGARRALVEGKKSLLPAGVKGVEGTFERGDLVEVVDMANAPIAKGLINYSNGDVVRIMGRKTAQVREILGEIEYEEIIHRDNLIVLG